MEPCAVGDCVMNAIHRAAINTILGGQDIQVEYMREQLRDVAQLLEALHHKMNKQGRLVAADHVFDALQSIETALGEMAHVETASLV